MSLQISVIICHIYLGMRSSRMIRVSDCQANAKVATVLGWIPASTDTVESERRQMKHCRTKYVESKSKKSPFLHINVYTDRAGFNNYLSSIHKSKEVV